MLYELRIYEAMPGKLPALNTRFATVTIPLWKTHGIRPVAFWTEDIGTSNQLVYMLAWESLAEREQKWTAFQADPEWQARRAETEREGPWWHGCLTASSALLLIRLCSSARYGTG